MGRKIHQKKQSKVEQKKVAEKNKKIRKEARQDPSARKRLKKDPGVPNLGGAKEDLLKQLRGEKKAAFKAAEKAYKDKKGNNNQQQQDRMVELGMLANKKNEQYEERELLDVLQTESNALKDTSKKTFFREFKKVVKAADVILEVLDARDPLGSRSPTIEKQIIDLDPNKKIVLILNKIDLIPRQNLMKWLSYLRDEYPTIAFKSTTQKQKTNLGRSKVLATKASDDSNESTSLGTETLLQLLKNYSRSGNTDKKQSISVGIIGFPNVGKSSLINTLKRSKVVNVGARPGVTRAISEITLDKNITLIDCPGIIFATDMSASDAALRNCINFEQLTDPLLPIEAILNRCAAEKLMVLYGIGLFNSPLEFLRLVAEKRGKMMRGGIVDIEGTAQMVIHDWNSGKIPYYTIPPESQFAKNRLSATIVSQWSEAFKLEDIMEMEKSTVLPGLEDDSSFHSNAIALPASQPAQVHEGFLDLNSLEDTLSEMDTQNNNKNNKQSTGETALGPIKERKETEKERKKKIKEELAAQNDAIEEVLKEKEEEEEEEEKEMKLAITDSFWTQALPTSTTNNK